MKPLTDRKAAGRPGSEADWTFSKSGVPQTSQWMGKSGVRVGNNNVGDMFVNELAVRLRAGNWIWHDGSH